MKADLFKTNREVIILGIVLSLTALFFSSIIWIGIILILFLFALNVHTSKSFIAFFILIFLVVSNDLGETLRAVLDSIAIVYLVFIFFKRYGMRFSSFPRISKNITYFISFLLILMLLSSWFSDSIITGLTGTGRQLIFFIIWYIMFSFLDEINDVFRYTAALIASGFAIALTIIYSFFSSNTGIFLLETRGIIHEGGIFTNVAAAAGVLDVSIPLTFVLILFYPNNKKLKYFLIGLISVQCLGLFFTNSRESILAAVISTSVILFILKRKTFYKLFIASLTVFCLLFLTSPVFTNLFDTYFRINRVLENTRYYLWDISLRIIRDNPIWGVGPGQFKSQMYNHINVMLGSWQEEQIAWIYKASGMGESHNFILFRTTELGLGGLISAILLPLIFIRYSTKVMQSYLHDKKVYYLVVGIFSLGIGLFTRSFFEATGLISQGWISRDLPFWLCFAIIIFLEKIKLRENENTNAC